MMKALLAPLTGVVLVLAFELTGCSSGAEYKTVNVKSELCSYSFEYSSFYKLDGPSTDLQRVVPYTDLSLIGPSRSLETNIIDPATGETKIVTGETGSVVIYVEVYNQSRSRTGPQNARERLEQEIRGMSRWKNYKLLERSKVTVSGIEAELVAYLSDMLLPIPVEDGKNLEYTRGIYFDHNGLIWVIRAVADQDLTDKVKDDFDHIIQTFKILD